MARVKAELAAAGTPTGATAQLNVERAAGIESKMAPTAKLPTGRAPTTAETTPSKTPLTAGGAFVSQVNKLTQEKIATKRDELLSLPDNYDNQLDLQRGKLYEALAGEMSALTPEKLRWLSPEQQAAIRSGDKQLIKNAIIGLNSISQFREDRKTADAEKAAKQFELLSESGASLESLPPGLLSGLDAASGLPSGTYEAIYSANLERTASESETAQLENASKLAGVLSNIPAGQSITVGGKTYTGWGTGNLLSGTEEDSNGNVTVWSVDPITGQITTTNLGPIGTASGWERETDVNGVIWSVNPTTGQRKMLVDPNSPNGGYASGGVIDLFPTGTVLETRGQCGEFVNDLTGLGVGDTFASKMAMMDTSIVAESAQVGDVVTMQYGTTGHVGIINNIQATPDGLIQYQLTESNWAGANTVTHTRWVSSAQISGYARPGFVDPAYNFGTDAGGNPLLDNIASQYLAAKTPAERNAVLTQAESVGLKTTAVVNKAMSLPIPDGTLVSTISGQLATLSDTQSDDISQSQTLISMMSEMNDLIEGGGWTDVVAGAFGPLGSGIESIFGQDADTGAFQGWLTKLKSGLGVSDEASRLTSLMSDFRSTMFKLRSGAAVTPTEQKNLEDALPSLFAAEGTNQTRLREFTTTLVERQKRLQGVYGAEVKGYTIEVKDKKTGQVGYIPVSEFSRDKYEIVL